MTSKNLAISNLFTKIGEILLETLFPIHCISCKKEKQWLCERCIKKLKLKSEQVCGLCEKQITPDGRTCQACRKKTSLDGFIICSSYSEPCISQSIHFFKYRFIRELYQALGDIMARVMQKTDAPLPDVIIPVPLHPRRLRWRGFNQSELLATRLAEKLLPQMHLRMDSTLLLRNRYTPPQMEIKNHKNRHRNIAGAFSVSNEEKIRGKICLLVDDIATTGSTILECAKILKLAGAKEVFAITLARQDAIQTCQKL